MLIKWVNRYRDRVSRYRDLFRDVLVHLEFVDYTSYVSLQSFVTCEHNFKEQILLIHFLLYFLFIINLQWLLDHLLPDHSKIAPWSSEALMSNFFLALEAKNFNPHSKIAFPDPIPYSVNDHSKIFLTEDPPGWTAKLPASSVEFRDTSCTHTASQR